MIIYNLLAFKKNNSGAGKFALNSLSYLSNFDESVIILTHLTPTDFSIAFDDFKDFDRFKFINAIPQLIKSGFEIIRTKAPDDLVTFMRHDEYIDVGIFSNKRLGFCNYFKYQNNLIDKYFLENLDEIQFLGLTFKIPSNVDEFLVKNYGKDWNFSQRGEPALPLGTFNLIHRFRRKLVKTKTGMLLKSIYNRFRSK